MHKQTFLVIFLLSFFFTTFSQEKALYQYNTIPETLKKNANAIVRYDNVIIEVISYDKFIYRNKRIVTVLNENGQSKISAYADYDDDTYVKKLEAKIFNSLGEEIEKIKKKDFLDESAVDGGTLYSDSRVKYLNYIPKKYPFTVAFYSEIEYKSTAFIPQWQPLEGFYISTQNSSYVIDNKSGIEIKIKTSNFENYNITEHSAFNYYANNLKALKREAFSPNFKQYTPSVKAALVEFNMEGVRGVNNNWKDFGKWINEKLLHDTQEIPNAIKEEVVTLTQNAETDLEKAKIIYQYMQSKTRYISVQIGIGGWKPMLAEDVNRLGYADCKGLTNFTKALLKEVGVESHYTVLFAGNSIRDIDTDFSATSGNHAILCLPSNDNYIWLECTSQTSPFGYNANFTDDRDVLVITPEGGEIVHTKKYESGGNKQSTKALIHLSETGDFKAKVNISTEGSQYGHHEYIQRESSKDQKLYYKDYWSNINNLKLNLVTFNDDKNAIVFSETIDVEAQKYAMKAGNRLLLKPNFFNISSVTPRRYEDRKLPVKLDRGFLDEDEYEIYIPNTLKADALFKPINIKTKFGDYASSLKEENEKLIYKRRLKINKGLYTNNEYEAFRQFWLDVQKADNIKIVLLPTKS